MKNRLKKFRKTLAENELDAMLVTGADNRRYLSGFTGSNGWLVITKRKAYLITDGRYWLQSAKEAPGYILVKPETKGKDSMFKAFSALLGRLNLKGTLGFESDLISYDDYRNLKKHTRGIKLKKAAGIIEGQRMIKDADEISLIKKSASLSDRVLKKVIEELAPGVTEKETAAKIHYLIESGGAESFSFPCIVAFGPNSALPHYSPGKNKIEKK